MSERIDYSTKLTTCLVRNEIHQFEGTKPKIIISKTGLFYKNSLVVRTSPTSNTLVEGVDYIPIIFSSQLLANTGYEACLGIIVLGKYNDIYITYQRVFKEPRPINNSNLDSIVNSFSFQRAVALDYEMLDNDFINLKPILSHHKLTTETLRKFGIVFTNVTNSLNTKLGALKR